LSSKRSKITMLAAKLGSNFDSHLMKSKQVLTCPVNTRLEPKEHYVAVCCAGTGLNAERISCIAKMIDCDRPTAWILAGVFCHLMHRMPIRSTTRQNALFRRRLDNRPAPISRLRAPHRRSPLRRNRRFPVLCGPNSGAESEGPFESRIGAKPKTASCTSSRGYPVTRRSTSRHRLPQGSRWR
jgi:hypothetical protein